MRSSEVKLTSFEPLIKAEIESKVLFDNFSCPKEKKTEKNKIKKIECLKVEALVLSNLN